MSNALQIIGISLILGCTLTARAQNVGINTTGSAGHASAMLDVSASDKGVLFPNVTLTGASDNTTVATPAKGLLVWNTGTAWGTAGFYYNDGSTGAPNWIKVATGSTAVTHTLTNPVNTISSTVNGVTATAPAVNTVSNTSSANTISTTVNGVAGTGVSIINSNALTWTKAGNLAGSVNGQNASVTVGSGTVADVLGYNAAGAPVYESLSSVIKEPWYLENSTTPASSNTQNIYQNAKVGIGNFTAGQTFNTGSPVATLEVTGAAASLRVGPRYDAGGDRDYIDLLADGVASKISTVNEGFVIENAGNGYLAFETNDLERMYINAAGNVGIGTNAPNTKLHINGSTYIPSGQSYWIGSYSDAGDRLRLHHSGTMAYIDYATADLNFRAGSTPKVIFQSDGDIQSVNLAGTGNRPVYADASGVLNTGVPTYKVASTLHPSNDDIAWGTTIRNSCADDAVAAINWDFNFMINGTAYTGGWISTNGVLGFGSSSSTSWSNTALPAGISNDPMLFFHWDDDGSSLQRYVVLGTAPHRICYIHSRQSNTTGCATGAAQVEVYITLHETSNIISVRYLGIGSDADTQGASATYGFQFAGGSSAYSIPLGYNAKLLDDNNGNQTFSIDLGK